MCAGIRSRVAVEDRSRQLLSADDRIGEPTDDPRFTGTYLAGFG